MANILLVDDNAKYLKDALPFYGHNVLIANDGIQALKTLERNFHNIDIILLDVMMPNMDGWQTLRAIRSSELYEHVPVIMLTAVCEDQKMVAGLKNGADDYIVKPFILPNLLARIETVLRRSKNTSKPLLKSKTALEPLTSKEKEVLQLAAKGFSNKDISEKLFVKEVTVKTHLNSIFKKLKVSNRTQAVLLAMQTEIV